MNRLLRRRFVMIGADVMVSMAAAVVVLLITAACSKNPTPTPMPTPTYTLEVPTVTTVTVPPTATPTSTAAPKPTATTTPTPTATYQQPSEPKVKSFRTLTENGGRLDWSDKLDLIAFDKKGGDGFFDIYVMRPDGSEQGCLTCSTPGLPQRHIGWPAWHPSGEYIVAQVEKAVHRGGSIQARPGIGRETNIWVITANGNVAVQLTDLPDNTGTLRPVFSHDGSKLLWAEMVEPPPKGQFLGGVWVMRLADFVVDATGPHLANVKTLQPGGPVFYETHGFYKDDSKIIFSANMEPGQPVWGLDIYTVDLVTGQVERLTDTLNQWDEHGIYSPDFRKIVWESSMECGCDPSNLADIRTELWMMNADGTDKRRLTHFNDSTYPEYRGERIITADSAWGRDGKRVLVHLIPGRSWLEYLNIIPEKEPLVMIEFE